MIYQKLRHTLQFILSWGYFENLIINYLHENNVCQIHPIPPNSFYIPINIFSFQLYVLCFKSMKFLGFKFYFSPKNNFDKI